MYPISKYKFYTTPDHKTIAVSSYAGKTVKGVAKMDPRDTFDIDFGKKLAAARCAVKVAKKRRKRAREMLNKALVEHLNAKRKVDKMKRYLNDAEKDLDYAVFNMLDIENIF